MFNLIISLKINYCLFSTRRPRDLYSFNLGNFKNFYLFNLFEVILNTSGITAFKTNH